MAEGSYEYACMRAELLNIEKPDRDTFMQQLREKEALLQQEEDLEVQKLVELQKQSEDLRNIGGNLDELNNILSVTQKKINKFKTACGSLTNLLKIRVGQGDSTDSINKIEPEQPSEPTATSELPESLETLEARNIVATERKKDMKREVESQVDKLDSLVTKAENAQYSMQYQTKQIKKLLQ